MSDAEIISKFRANASAVLSKEQQDKVIDLTWRFDELDGELHGIWNRSGIKFYLRMQEKS